MPLNYSYNFFSHFIKPLFFQQSEAPETGDFFIELFIYGMVSQHIHTAPDFYRSPRLILLLPKGM